MYIRASNKHKTGRNSQVPSPALLVDILAFSRYCLVHMLICLFDITWPPIWHALLRQCLVDDVLLVKNLRFALHALLVAQDEGLELR